MSELRIEQDKKNSHAVFFDDCAVSFGSDTVAARIAVGYSEINRRALDANMVVLNQHIATSSYCTPEGAGHVCTTIICQWVGRADLEKMQLQQRLMGQQNGGRG